MKCPVCGGAELINDTRDMPYVYKGESTVMTAVEGDFCPACNEVVLNMVEAKRCSDLAGEFHQQVNASFVEPIFITAVRKKLKLDQQEAGKIFGGGINAFSRYENGRTKPSLALVKLLRILDKHPDLLPEVMAS